MSLKISYPSLAMVMNYNSEN